MNYYKSDYAIEKTLNFKPSLEQKFLIDYTGRNLPAKEAERVWLRVIDHKWFVSEQLNRDIGLRVAAVDYMQNYYKPTGVNEDDGFLSLTQKFIRTLFGSFGESIYSNR